MYSRREFGQMVVGGVTLSLVGGARTLFASGLTVGATTTSFHELPRTPGKDNINDVIRALQESRIHMVELFADNAEPAGPDRGPAALPKPAAYPRPVIILSQEEIAAARLVVRNALRDWRMTTPQSYWQDVKNRFAAAGITIHSFAVDYTPDFTDEEIAMTFRQARSLGANVVAAPAMMTLARRLAPLANASGTIIAFHNQPDARDADAAVAAEQLADILALSPNFRLKLDVANLTAANCDCVSALQQYLPKISHVQVHDRLRNNGRSEKFGSGDTPLAAVMTFVKNASAAIPTFVEYDYVGLGSPVEEVSQCVDYVTRIAG